MAAAFFYSLLPYQIFKSVLFRSGMIFLTSYMIVIFLMPYVIRIFRKHHVTSDFISSPQTHSTPYTGATPIMGGGVLVFAVIIGVLLWCNLNQFVIALLAIMFAFACIGAVDDFSKVLSKRRVESGKESQKNYANKADGIGGKLRLTMEFIVAFFVVIALYLYIDIDGHLVIPFIPLKEWYPYLPKYLFIPLMLFIIVGGANAVNLTDGMDSLATVPLITCAIFAAAAAYVGADIEWSARLKIPNLTEDLKEVAIFAIAIVSVCLTFLRFNAPPASIYMGDLGALALGSVVSTMFIFIKAELFLPIVGGVFVLSALSVVIQVCFFKIIVWKYDISIAQKYRFFLRAPYHHHLQQMWTYSSKPHSVISVWLLFLQKLKVPLIPNEEKMLHASEVQSRVVWLMHLKSIWLFVITIVIYFKVR